MSLINKEDLMKTLGITDMDCEKCYWYDRATERCKRGSDFEDACIAIDDAPEVKSEPKWILVSERLPEENMLTICQNNAGAMMIGKYDIEFGWMFPAYFDGIVAWMPAPERYREEGE